MGVSRAKASRYMYGMAREQTQHTKVYPSNRRDQDGCSDTVVDKGLSVEVTSEQRLGQRGVHISGGSAWQKEQEANDKSQRKQDLCARDEDSEAERSGP